MSKYYLIGFGGTGSKCVESYIHLACTGLSPHEVNVVLVDQDQSNGNVAYTKQVMKIYQNLYYDLRTGDNNLGPAPFLNTLFKYPSEGLCWAPLPENRNLKEIFNVHLMKPEIQWLLKVLFQENVITMPLDKGFLGQSNAGVAVLLSVLMSKNGFWQEFMEDIISAVNGGEDVYVFLIASTFGGTGTSGFPTFARLIHEHLAKEGIVTEKVHLGGALLLPYFRFPMGNSDGTGEVAAHSQYFLENTQAAFKHYYRLFKEKKLFETIYFVGWDPQFELTLNSKGGEEQHNPPLPPELLAAHAVWDYFKEPKQGYARIARRMNGDMTWDDMPDIRKELGSMVRYCFAYLAGYHRFLQTPHYEKFKSQAWFKKLIIDEKIALNTDRNKKTLKNLEKYCREYLQWVASIFYSEDKMKGLIDIDSFANYLGSENRRRIELRPPDEFKMEKYGNLVAPGNEKSMEEIFKELCMDPIKFSTSTGLGTFNSSLYEHCMLNEARAERRK